MSGNWYESYPLPPGVEKKYDFTTKRFFFIDHTKKVTTWEDPRIKFYANQQHAQPQPVQPRPQQQSAGYGWQSTPVAAFQNLQPSNVPTPSPSPRPQQAALPMAHLQPTQQRRGSRRTSETEVMETALDIDLGHHFEAMALQTRFPTVERSYIDRLLEKHHGDQHKVEVEIKSDQEKVQFETELLTKLDQFKADFPEFDETKIRKVLTDCELSVGMSRGRLQRMRQVMEESVRELKADFPDADNTLLTRVFQLCDAKVSTTREKLIEMGFKKGGTPKEPEVPPTSDSTSRDKSPSQPTRVASATPKEHPTPQQKRKMIRLLSKEFSVDQSEVEMQLTLADWVVNKARERLRESTKKPQSMSPIASEATQSVRSPRSSSSSASSRPLSPSQVTPKLVATKEKTRVVKKKVDPAPKPKQVKQKTVQPSKPRTAPSTPKSKRHQNSTLALGPNPYLSNGPDMALLSRSETSLAMGHSPQLSQGPCTKLLSGESRVGALGPNPEFRHGPNTSLLRRGVAS